MHRDNFAHRLHIFRGGIRQTRRHVNQTIAAPRCDDPRKRNVSCRLLRLPRGRCMAEKNSPNHQPNAVPRFVRNLGRKLKAGHIDDDYMRRVSRAR